MRKIRTITVLMLIVFIAVCITGCSDGGQQSSKAQSAVSEASDTSEQSSEVSKDQSGSERGLTNFHVKKKTEQSQTEPESETLVLYFSVTGETVKTAQKLAAAIDADIYEIIPKVQYQDYDLNVHDSDSRANKEMDDPAARPEIEDNIKNLNSYKTIYLGYPIWWEEAPRIMSTFVETHDLSGITVVPFCTSLKSDIGDSAKKLAELTGQGNWVEGRRFSGDEAEAELKSWAEKAVNS